MVGSRKTVVSDIAFVAVSSAMQTIEVQARLVQVSDSAVSSFYFNKHGLDKLIRNKFTTLNELVENRRRVQAYIYKSEYPLDTNIAIVATSMISTLAGQIDSVKEQITRGKKLTQYNQKTIKMADNLGELSCEEIPF